MRLISILVVGLLGTLQSVGVAAAPVMEPGMWEVSTKMTLVGMPMEMPPQVVRHCYREEHLKDPKSVVPQGQECKADAASLSGNTVSWRASCKIDGESMAGDGRITFSGKSYVGKAQLVGKVEGMAMQMNVSYSGKRIGACK